MASDVQGPSGTGLDPSPQFWIDRIERDSAGPLAVIGRCFFGPVRMGLLFDGVVPEMDGDWPASDVVTCRLSVVEIRVFGKLTDEISQLMSARLVLSGQAPPCLASNEILVARGRPVR